MTHPDSLASDFEARFSRPTRALSVSEQVSQRAFLGASLLLFILSSALTALWCNSMSAKRGMPMPGGWTMSMAWMRMPGQSWTQATVSFTGMWGMMMVAMMLPSLVPMLWRYRQSIGWAGQTLRGWLTALVGLGYFLVWTLFGLAVFLVGVTVAAVEMEQPAVARPVPLMAGLIVLLAGAIQFTKWKALRLACCREAPGRDRALPAHTGRAWRLGLHFGFHCGLSCANLTVILLVIGVMDLRAMAAVTAAISAERLAPAGEQVARVIGAVIVGAGLLMASRAVGLL
jgi:predicted metal-binding membrane protein